MSQHKIARRTRAVLVERFPNCFKPAGMLKLPLSRNIDAAIKKRCPEIPWRVIKLTIDDYTNGPTYLSQLVEGAARVDLDGKAKGIVTEAHAGHARAKLESPRFANWKGPRRNAT